MSAALQTAIEQTDAVQVAIGYHAFKIGSMTRWRVFRDALLDGELNGGPATMGALNACSREMPEWWDPERMTQRRIIWSDGVVTTNVVARPLHIIVRAGRITADLDTGKEVAA